MTNLDVRPGERICRAGDEVAGVQLLAARDVPLGGLRAMTVRRTIPQKARSLVGAWCFCDHYGPDDVTRSGGMQVPPHPHTGLQTVTWLFAGEIEHRDSVGSHLTVRPGELNLMTAGAGISHSERSVAAARAPLLHGVQLWTALPASALHVGPRFEHHDDLPVLVVDGGRVQVFMGALGALRSPATTYTPLVGAQVDLLPGGRLDLDVNPEFEHALLVDAGDVTFAGAVVPRDQLAYVAPGRDRIVVEAGLGGPARAILLGGVPFGEQIVMWWNFVGRSHDDVARARGDWMRQVADDGADGPTRYADGAADRRFGVVGNGLGEHPEIGEHPEGPLRAPVLPAVRLRPRNTGRP